MKQSSLSIFFSKIHSYSENSNEAKKSLEIIVEKSKSVSPIKLIAYRKLHIAY